MGTGTENLETKGWLYKWTNYAKGYKRRWFIISKGLLSYYRKPTEEVNAQRGVIYLENAIFHSYNTCSFVISKTDGKNTFYLKAETAAERDNWISCLEREKVWAIRHREANKSLQWYANFEEHERDILSAISEVGSKVEYLQDTNVTFIMSGSGLKDKLATLQNLVKKEEFPPQLILVKGQAKVFQESGSLMIKALFVFIDLALMKYGNTYALLQSETEQKYTLEKVITQLDDLLSLLESAIASKDMSVIWNNYSLDTESLDDTLSVKSSKMDKSFSSYEMDRTNEGNLIPDDLKGSLSVILGNPGVQSKRSKRVRRSRVPDKPNLPVNLWSVMKNSIGKDLSKIPMPVNFSEPISFLQRAAEDFTYSDLLDKAAICTDQCEQLAYLGAFLVSSYASTAHRTAKPFNPLLGETFEWDRTDDLGWRLISEQVSHHPPISAQFCESKEWTCWQEFAMSSKFRGKYLMIVPHGVSHIVFNKTGNHYTWTKVTTIVNNIILGKLWVDNVGDTEVLSKKNNSKCQLAFVPYSVFKSEDQRKVMGQVMNNEQEVKYIISGKWDTEIKMSPVVKKTGKPDNPVYETGNSVTLWILRNPPEDSYKYYNFNIFTCQLNEMEEDVAPTDSRRRPDQRLMENGQWDEANIMKTELEERQRAKRKSMYANKDRKNSEANVSRSSSTSAEEYPLHEPIWFKTEMDSSNGRVSYIYQGGYWEAKTKQNWERCPKIYS